MAGRVRFELTVPYSGTAVFKTAAINRSATYPLKLLINHIELQGQF